MKVKEIIAYFEDLYNNGAIYVWGANGEVITKELCNTLFKKYGTAKYNERYYNERAKHAGKIGADCSGAFRAVSGFDGTAWDYYNLCSSKGKIEDIDKNKPCLVFKRNGSKVTHIGFYCGNGYTIEMQSSTTNCVKQKLEVGSWTHFGIPTWIDYSDWYQDLIGVVNTGALNLRAEPNNKSNVLGVLYEDTQLLTLEEEKDGWYYVKVGGWVNGRYVI